MKPSATLPRGLSDVVNVRPRGSSALLLVAAAALAKDLRHNAHGGPFGAMRRATVHPMQDIPKLPWRARSGSRWQDRASMGESEPGCRSSETAFHSIPYEIHGACQREPERARQGSFGMSSH